MHPMTLPAADTTAPTSWQLGPEAPQSPRRWLRALGRAVFFGMGWRFEGQMPNVPRFVAMVAPHTSNWDFPKGVLWNYATKAALRWVAKESWFRFPLG